ncbi:MAG: amidase [Myxococcaceae bacterium]|nr:amidase [Myxococcaceae bacterium]
MRYSREPVKAPRVAGVALRAFVNALESTVGSVILNKLVTDSGIARFRETSAGHASPIQVPLPLGPEPTGVTEPRALALTALTSPTVVPGVKLETAAAFREAYQAGATDPTRVIRKLEDAIFRLEGGDQPMNFFISRKEALVLADAEKSTARWRAGAPLSALDGVPVVLKDEVDLEGFVTTLGTKFRTDVATKDSTVAERLKAAGAIILGKANMNEIGINPIGLNPHHGPARNPFDRTRITGGSSSASAAVVAAGLCPISIGADGGGSIRIPAALCGVVGLKATFGRISEAGVPPLCWNPGHVGPLGLTVADVAAAYALIAGPDERDPVSMRQPPLHLTDFERRSLEGVRVGVCQPYFEDAEPDVVARCREALKVLTDAGAKVVELPPPDLNLILWSHSIIILSEMREAMHDEVLKDSTRFALDSRTNLAIGGHFTSRDYVHAMRHRHKLTREWLELMRTCDVVATPTTACTAPLIPEATLPDGESNLPVVDQLMRFIRVGNLTGFPALSLPVGLDALGLPVGLQLMARPYQEHLLLRLGRVIESTVPRSRPRVHVTALS